MGGFGAGWVGRLCLQLGLLFSGGANPVRVLLLGGKCHWVRFLGCFIVALWLLFWWWVCSRGHCRSYTVTYFTACLLLCPVLVWHPEHGSSLDMGGW